MIHQLPPKAASAAWSWDCPLNIRKSRRRSDPANILDTFALPGLQSQKGIRKSFQSVRQYFIMMPPDQPILKSKGQIGKRHRREGSGANIRTVLSIWPVWVVRLPQARRESDKAINLLGYPC